MEITLLALVNDHSTQRKRRPKQQINDSIRMLSTCRPKLIKTYFFI